MLQHLGRRDRGFGSITLGVKQTGDDYFVCLAKRVFELLLEELYLRRVRARLEDREEAAAGVPGARGEQGLAHCRGVMREVIDYRNTAHLSSYFQAPLDAFELRHRHGDRATIERKFLACCDHAQAVANIEQTCEGSRVAA